MPAPTTPEPASTLDDDVDSVENFYEKQVLKLTTIASISSIIANLLITATILRFRNLRQSTTFAILLHVVLVQIASLVLDEVLLWFFTYFGTPLPQYHTEFCVMFVSVRMMNGLSFLVIILLVCNWYLRIYSSDSKYAKFRKLYRYLLVAMYVACILIFPILTKLCLKKDVFVTFYVVVSFQIVMIVFTASMTVVQRCKSWRSQENVRDIGLGCANIIVIFCSPAYLFLVLVYCNLVPVYVVLLADVLATGVFPFVLFYLYRYDSTFQMYFKKLFSCGGNTTRTDSVTYNLLNDQ